MVRVTMLRDRAKTLRSLALNFSNPQICGELMDLANKCEALADKVQAATESVTEKVDEPGGA